MNETENKREVLANDKNIAMQVPGVLLDPTEFHPGLKKPQDTRNEELFYRAIGR